MTPLLRLLADLDIARKGDVTATIFALSAIVHI
jgi:hypothetical protein